MDAVLEALVRQGALRPEDAAACTREGAATGESPVAIAVRRRLVPPEVAGRAFAASAPRRSPPPRPTPLQPPAEPIGLATDDAPTTPPTRRPEPSVARSNPATFPRRFGRYELLRPLGEGGMGVVYEARDPSLGRTVALKMLGSDGRLPDQVLRRFEREARSSARLRHANVCQIFETGEVDGVPYFTMELVKGGSLAGLIESAGHRGLPWRRACAIVRDAARGLAHAHAQGVVHRDVKPSNVLLDESGRGVVVDFGLARDEENEDQRLSRTGQLLGTPLYMAPERFGKDGNKDPKPITDVYALGVTLYEALSGELPFGGDSVYSLFAEIQKGSPRPPRVEAGTPPDATAVVFKAIARLPEKRYPTADALADDLDHVLAGEPIAGRGPTLRESVRARPGFFLALGVAATLAPLVLAGSVLYRSTRPAVAQAPGPTSPTPALSTPAPPPPPPPPLPSAPPSPAPLQPPRNAKEAIERARARLWLSDLEGSRTAYRLALKLHPGDVDAMLEGALVGTFLEDTNAVVEAQPALFAHPEHPAASVLFQMTSAGLGARLPMVGRAPQETVDAHPIAPFLHLYQARAQRDAKKQRALQRVALGEKPRCGLLALELADGLGEEGHYDEALRLVEEERDYEGVAADLRAASRGLLLEQLKRPDEADRAYATVRAPPGLAVKARGRRAALAIARGDFEAAVSVHGGREPGSLDDRVALARALLALGKRTEARSVLDLAVEVSETGGDAMGVARAAGAGDSERQLIAAGAGLLQDKDATRASDAVRARRARLAAREGDLKAAVSDLKQFYDDECAERFAAAGTICWKKGDLKSAVKLLATACDAKPGPAADAWLDRALALEADGQVRRARTCCAEAARDPTLKAATDELAARLERASSAARAEQVVLDKGLDEKCMTGDGKGRWLVTSTQWVPEQPTIYGFAPALEIPEEAAGRTLAIEAECDAEIGLEILPGEVETGDHSWWRTGHGALAEARPSTAPRLEWKVKPGTYTLLVARHLGKDRSPAPLALKRLRVTLR